VEGLAGVILNVGCGRFPVAGAVNVDCVALPTVDVVHDLDVTPWPFNDAAFHEVRGVQVFEHVRNPIGFMCESWRVLKPGGLLFLAVPHYQSRRMRSPIRRMSGFARNTHGIIGLMVRR
jgi:predicted SAM-dependent methyltransferase